MRQSATRFAWIAGLTALTLAGASTARAQTVTFSDISDAVPGRFFDTETTRQDANTLTIGFNSDFDFRRLRYTDFRASTSAFSYTSAMDTISFTVAAPEGYYLRSITYTQAGYGGVIRTGRAAGMANWVVGDFAADLGVFGTNPALSETMDLEPFNLTRMSVSISNSLFAFSTPALGSATVAVTSAQVYVDLVAVPSPPEPEPSEPEPSPEPPSAPTPEPIAEPPAPPASTPEASAPPPAPTPEPSAPPPAPAPEPSAPPPAAPAPEPSAPPLDPTPVL